MIPLDWLTPSNFFQYVVFVAFGTGGFFTAIALSATVRRWFGIDDDEVGARCPPSQPGRASERPAAPRVSAAGRTFRAHHRRLRRRTFAEHVARLFTGGSPKLH